MTPTAEALSSYARTRVRSTQLAVVTVAGLLVSPALVGTVSLLGRHWYATGDYALEVLRIGDVGSRHTPLVGVWSRFGWYHPGPLLFLLLAPAQRLLGETGVLAGVALLNGAALVGAVIVAARRGGTALVLWSGLLVAGLVHALGPGLLLDPWNPWVAVLPFLCFALLAWSVACGDHRALPWAAGVGSFVVQTHVGYAPLVVGLLAVAILVVALGSARAGLGRWLALAGLVTALLWLPPVIQQVAGHPGNLSQVAGYFIHPAGSVAGWKTAFGVMGNELTPPGPWLTGGDTNGVGIVATAAAWPAVLVILSAIGAGVLAWRRGAHDAARLAVVAVAMAVIGLVATARLIGILGPYEVRWWWVVALLLWLSIGWCLVEALGALPARRVTDALGRGRNGPGWAAPVGVLVAVVGTVALVAASVTAALPAPLPFTPQSETIAHLAPSTARAVGRDGPVLLRWIDPEAISGVGDGMFTALRRAGVDVVAPPEQGDSVGAWRTVPPGRLHGVITGESVPDPTILLPRPPPDSRLVASYDPLPVPERQEAILLQRRIRTAMGPRAPQGPLVVPQIPFAQALLVAAGASRQDVSRLAELQARGSPYVVYFAPGHG